MNNKVLWYDSVSVVRREMRDTSKTLCAGNWRTGHPNQGGPDGGLWRQRPGAERAELEPDSAYRRFAFGKICDGTKPKNVVAAGSLPPGLADSLARGPSPVSQQCKSSFDHATTLGAALSSTWPSWILVVHSFIPSSDVLLDLLAAPCHQCSHVAPRSSQFLVHHSTRNCLVVIHGSHLRDKTRAAHAELVHHSLVDASLPSSCCSPYTPGNLKNPSPPVTSHLVTE